MQSFRDYFAGRNRIKGQIIKDERIIQKAAELEVKEITQEGANAIFADEAQTAMDSYTNFVQLQGMQSRSGTVSATLLRETQVAFDEINTSPELKRALGNMVYGQTPEDTVDIVRKFNSLVREDPKTALERVGISDSIHAASMTASDVDLERADTMVGAERIRIE